jgi:hypothetical protein
MITAAVVAAMAIASVTAKSIVHMAFSSWTHELLGTGRGNAASPGSFRSSAFLGDQR